MASTNRFGLAVGASLLALTIGAAAGNAVTLVGLTADNKLVKIDTATMAEHLRVSRTVGVPYTDDQISNAVADLKAQADPDNAGTDAFAKRYPKAVVRNFDGRAGAPTEMDALVAYLQMLGTLVDFKLYNEKANLR